MFLMEFEDKVLEPQRLMALDEALKDTPARWWATQKNTITWMGPMSMVDESSLRQCRGIPRWEVRWKE